MRLTHWQEPLQNSAEKTAACLLGLPHNPSSHLLRQAAKASQLCCSPGCARAVPGHVLFLGKARKMRDVLHKLLGLARTSRWANSNSPGRGHIMQAFPSTSSPVPRAGRCCIALTLHGKP